MWAKQGFDSMYYHFWRDKIHFEERQKRVSSTKKGQEFSNMSKDKKRRR